MKSYSTILRKLTAKLGIVALMATSLATPLSSTALADGAVLRVTVVPAQASYNLYDGNIKLISGSPYTGNQIFSGMPQGSYTVEFLPLEGYSETPGTETITLFPGDDEEVVGVYGNDEPETGGLLVVNVHPEEGTYNIYDGNLELMAGSPFAGDQLFSNTTQGSYTVEFLPLEGYLLPEPATVTDTVQPNEETVIEGVYRNEPVTTGVLEVHVVPQEATYNVYDGNLSLMAGSPFAGDQQFDGLAQGSYTVEFLPLEGYNLPEPATVTVTVNPDDTVMVTGVYELIDEPTNGTLVVDVTPEQASYNIYDGNLELMAGSPFTGDTQTDVAQGSYTVEFLPFAGYDLPEPAMVTDTVNPNKITTIVGVYTPSEVTGRVVVTVTDDQGNAFADADYDILLNNNAVHSNQTGDFDEMNQSTGQYSVTARSVTVGGTTYNPSVALVSGSDSIVAQNDVVEFAVTYNEEAQPTTGRVTVNQVGAVGIVELVGPSSETVNAATFTNPNATAGNYTLGAVTAPAGFHLDTVTDENGNILSTPYSQNLNAGGGITYNVNFASDQQPTTGRATVNQNGAVGTVELILPGPITETINQAVYDNAAAPAGSYTLGTIATPAGFQLTNVTDGNGTVLATPFTQSLNASGHITYNVNYTAVANNPVVTVSKAVDFATRQNGEYAEYTITIARSDNVNAAVNVDVVDTISGTNALTGNNGGQLSLVPNSAGCTTANNGQCGGDLITDAGGMNINLPDANSSVQITYRVQAVNAGIPDNQNSAVINTINTLDSNGQTATASVTVTVAGPQTNNNPSGCTVNCGGGGGGGGMRMMLGDMELLVEKLVSLNGADYRDASSHDLAVVVPENKSTRLYTKVRITNDNDVSAKNIKFNPFFDTGDSDMTASEIEDIEGAKLVSGDLMIAKIKAGETVEFSYSVLIHENGQNSNPAFDGVEVVDYESTLPISQDGLTYVTKGEQFVTYIYAGQIPAAVIKPVRKDSGNGSDVLAIQVSADRAEARIGDIVNYTITLQNVSDSDLTHLLIAHSYPAELDVMNTGGGRDDGRELHFSRAIMRPGESVNLQFSAKVVSGSAGQVVRSLTRAMVNEFENISPAESYLMIAGGTASAGPNYRLAQTGSGLLISLLLSLIAYLGYGTIQKRRYQALKKEALKF